MTVCYLKSGSFMVLDYLKDTTHWELLFINLEGPNGL